MANELTVTIPGAVNAYAIIRQQSTAAVYDIPTDAFVAWVDGDINNYDIVLSNSGGDLYVGNFPSTIASGTYILTYYKRAGASPAITDLIMSSKSIYWNTQYVVPTPPPTLSAYALIDLTHLKRYLNINYNDTSKDNVLIDIINYVTDGMEHECNRKFMARDFNEIIRVDVRTANSICVENVPVLRIYKVGFSQKTFAFINASKSNFLRAFIWVETDRIRIREIDNNGVETNRSLVFTTYGTVAKLVAEINSLSGWTATLSENAPSSEMIPSTSWDAAYSTYNLNGIDNTSFNTDYNFDPDIGAVYISKGNVTQLTTSPTNLRYAYVQYRAGYETIPDDLQHLCAKLCKNVYDKVGENAWISNISNETNVKTFRSLADVRLDEEKAILNHKLIPIGPG